MDHKPSSVMTDRDGAFQRCWGCGARRRVTRLGLGPWDKGSYSDPRTMASIKAQMEGKQQPTRPGPTQQELVDELFKQT